MNLNLDFCQELSQLNLLRPYLRERIIHNILADQILIDAQLQQISKDAQAILVSSSRKVPESLYQLTARLQKDSKLSRFKNERFANQVKTIFLQEKTSFDSLVFGDILLETRPLAFELYFRIRDDGISFWEIASSYSNSANQYSPLCGPVTLQSLPKSIVDHLAPFHADQLYSPVCSSGTWHLIFMIRHIRSTLTKKLFNQILDRLFDEFIRSQVDELMLELSLPANS
tara:strand:+ start:77 stop:760 length:684 start_codon:yes stop_codon:yes gene_type:complete